MAHVAWNVWLNGKLIDTVFWVPDAKADEIRRSLIGHDGYDSGIEVKKQPTKRAKKEKELG